MMGRSETVQDKLHMFHHAFNHPVGLKYPLPSAIVNSEKSLRRTLIQEEYKELMYAISNEDDDEVLKELCDLVYVCVALLLLTVGLLILHSIECISQTCLSWMKKVSHSIEKMAKWLSLIVTNHRNFRT